MLFPPMSMRGFPGNLVEAYLAGIIPIIVFICDFRLPIQWQEYPNYSNSVKTCSKNFQTVGACEILQREGEHKFTADLPVPCFLLRKIPDRTCKSLPFKMCPDVPNLRHEVFSHNSMAMHSEALMEVSSVSRSK